MHPLHLLGGLPLLGLLTYSTFPQRFSRLRNPSFGFFPPIHLDTAVLQRRPTRPCSPMAHLSSPKVDLGLRSMMGPPFRVFWTATWNAETPFLGLSGLDLCASGLFWSGIKPADFAPCLDFHCKGVLPSPSTVGPLFCSLSSDLLSGMPETQFFWFFSCQYCWILPWTAFLHLYGVTLPLFFVFHSGALGPHWWDLFSCSFSSQICYCGSPKWTAWLQSWSPALWLAFFFYH